MAYVETDSRSRLTLPGGRANRLYLIEELPDGVIILRPARVVSELQAAFDANTELQDRIEASIASGVSKRPRPTRRTRATED
jgi:hypothetical protein